MREPDQLTNRLRRGAAFLASVQLEDGGFESYSSPTRQPFKQARVYLTTFAPALILQALAAANEPACLPLRNKLAAWLLAQKGPNWSFNYWAVAAPERVTTPYPDDLDDTFCALIALHQHDPSLIDATCLGKVVNLLVAAESAVGGPYRTWLIGPTAPSAWQDVDLAVNSNIACFLRKVAKPLPNLTQFMEQAIAAGRLRSPYYPSIYPLAYFLARGYEGPHAASLAELLLQRQRRGAWGNPQDTALAITALVQLGWAQQCTTAVKRLLAWQKPDGSWPAAAFCADPSIGGQRHFGGSAALTTALAFEALSRYRQANQRSSKRRRVPAGSNILYDTVMRTVEDHLSTLPPSLQKRAQSMLDTMQQKTGTEEIILLPAYFNQSLQKPLANEILLAHLGAANLYGWMAYTIYDDFLDEEGAPVLLPVANLALRRSLANFQLALPQNEMFQKLVAATFDTIDNANTWELTHCRFAATKQTLTVGQLPDFGQAEQLAERSLGHALTSLGVLAALGHNLHNVATHRILQMFQHYLIARQLGDDMHDWEADTRAGQISFVVAQILQELHVSPGTHSFAKLIPAMQKQFWYHTSQSICAMIIRQTTYAQELSVQSRLFTPKNKINGMLDVPHHVAELTLQKQTKARAFLTAYRGS